MADETKIFDCATTEASNSCLSIAELSASGLIPQINLLPPQSYLFNTGGPEPPAQYIAARGEREIRKGGASIVLGSDRPNSLLSGFGGKGSSKAATIDLVVGRMASAEAPRIGSTDQILGIDNNFFADSARIYISQLTNVDINFGIATGGDSNCGQSAPQNACSAVALKADAVRIIGTEGVKIVTGRAKLGSGAGEEGELNSRSGRVRRPSPPIELIAGNNVSPLNVPGGKFLPGGRVCTLQPATMGLNTADALKELSDIIGEIWSAVFNLTLLQAGVTTAFGVDPLRPWVPAAASVTLPTQAQYVVNSLYHTRANQSLWEVNFLKDEGYKFVCSRNVKIT